MTIFLALLLAHLLADFLQPAALVKWSKNHFSGLIVHSLSYVILTTFVIYGVPDWWLWILLLGLSHLTLDNIKYSISRRYDEGSLYLFLFDQVFHIAIIAAVGWGLRASNVTATPSLQAVAHYSSWLPYLVGYVAGTFGVSILVFEADKTFMSVNGGQQRSVISFPDRLTGIMERAIALTFMILHMYYLVPLAFTFSIFRLLRTKPNDSKKKLFFDLVFSSASIIAIGMMLVLL